MDAASMEIPTNVRSFINLLGYIKYLVVKAFGFYQNLIQVDSQMLKKMAEFMILYQNSPFPEVVKPLKSSKLSDLVPDNVVAYLDVDKEVLYDMVIAADFLNIKPLLDAACAKIATFTKDKTEEQIRQAFM